MSDSHENTDNDEPTAPSGWLWRGDRPLRGQEAAEVARQMGEMAASGLPLGGGLRAVALELPPRDPLRRRLQLMADELDSGTPIGEVVGAQDDAFPPYFQGLIDAGVRTGRLPELLGEFAVHDRLAHELRRRVWLGLFYPCVLIGLCALLLAAFSIAGRAILATFLDFGVDLPAASMALLQIAEVLGKAGWWVLIGPLVALGLLFALVRFLFGAYERRQALRALPLLGPLVRWTALAEFCRVLASLVEAEVPLPEAVPMAGRSTRDAVLARASESAGSDLSGGRPLGASLAARKVLPAGFGEFLSWAEGYRSLAESLRLASEMFEVRARAQAEFLVSFVASMSLVLVLWGIGVVVFCVIWPMMRVISSFALL